MRTEWKASVIPLVIAFVCILPLVATAVLLIYVLPPPPAPFLVTILALLVAIVFLEFRAIDILRRPSWQMIWRRVKPRREGLADRLEAAFAEAGLLEGRRAEATRPSAPAREVFALGGGVTVLVETGPDGHVVRAGPYTDERQQAVERARRVVDAALADTQAR